MSNPEIAADMFPSDRNSNPFSMSSSDGFPEDAGWQKAPTHTTASKPSLVTRIRRVFKNVWVGLWNAVFSKQFWQEFVVSALRDAFAALGHSFGVRLIRTAAAAGDLNFQDKKGTIPPARVAATAAADAAFDNDRWKTPRRQYGNVMEDITASPTGGSYGHGRFNSPV